MSYLLTILIALPLLGVLVALLLPREEERLHRGWGLVVTLLTFLTSLALLSQSFSTGTMQLETKLSWIPSLGIFYHVGVDGISVWLLLLTTFLMPVVVFASTKTIQKQIREFIICLLLLEAGMIGAFVALDLFLFYVFWELMLIPMYFIIGLWGGERRVYASLKFVLYTMVGSLLMLAAVLFLSWKNYTTTGQWSFDLQTFLSLADRLRPHEQLFCFLGFALAFCVKIPLFPFHTWLPDAHVEAPTPGSVILAGVLLKFGTYGLLRFAIPLFPYAVTVLAPWISLFAAIGIVYGSLVAYAQTDIKKLIAYSSVAHMGVVVLGLFSLNAKSVTGSIYQMLAHGISTGGLFLCVGMLYERRHTRNLKDFGGLWQRMPIFGSLFLIFTMASIGLPALCGFVGEFLILLGTMSAQSSAPSVLSFLFTYSRVFCVIAASGVVLGAVYMLSMFEKTMLGPVQNPENHKLRDLSVREKAVLLPMVLLAFGLGIYPNFVMQRITPTVHRWQQDVYRALTKVSLRGQAQRPLQSSLRTSISLQPVGTP